LKPTGTDGVTAEGTVDTVVLPLTFGTKAQTTEGFWVGADTVEIAGISARLRPTFLHDQHVLPALPVPDGATDASGAQGSNALAQGRSVVASLPPARPRSLRGTKSPEPDLDSVQAQSTDVPAPPAPETPSLFGTLPRTPPVVSNVPAAASPNLGGRSNLNELIATYARLHSVPESLVHRVVIRESRYNPSAIGRGGAMGLMQIKTGTARGLGYTGGPTGLLDAETNLTYAVKYLAGAYRTAGGDHDRAVAYYARGYYYAAKHQGLIERTATSRPRPGRGATIIPDPPTTATIAAAAPTSAASDQR
jgi:hypothetical protein